MRLTVQRVLSAAVFVGGAAVCRIERGILCFVGFHRDDTDGDADWIARKALSMFYWESDAKVPWKKGVADAQASVVVVPEPGLTASIDFDDRPNFEEAMPAPRASELYGRLLAKMRAAYAAERVCAAPFEGAKRIDFLNDGPVTISVDSAHRRD